MTTETKEAPLKAVEPMLSMSGVEFIQRYEFIITDAGERYQKVKQNLAEYLANVEDKIDEYASELWWHSVLPWHWKNFLAIYGRNYWLHFRCFWVKPPLSAWRTWRKEYVHTYEYFYHNSFRVQEFSEGLIRDYDWEVKQRTNEWCDTSMELLTIVLAAAKDNPTASVSLSVLHIVTLEKLIDLHNKEEQATGEWEDADAVEGNDAT